MDNYSQNMLRRVDANDVECTDLKLGHSNYCQFISDYLKLGEAIGNNTHLESLRVALGDECALDVASKEFFYGLRRNSSMNNVTLHCNHQILVGGVEHEILKSYQKISNNLTYLCINEAILDNGGGDVITESLRWCNNLKSTNLGDNRITAEQSLPIVEAIKGGCYTSLEKLFLYGNRVSNAGCHALATLLVDTNCNLKLLSLETNQIGNEGATAIANSLANNTTLKTLGLRNNPFDSSVLGIFSRVLCNTSSVNDMYHSNTIHWKR